MQHWWQVVEGRRGSFGSGFSLSLDLERKRLFAGGRGKGEIFLFLSSRLVPIRTIFAPPPPLRRPRSRCENHRASGLKISLVNSVTEAITIRRICFVRSFLESAFAKSPTPGQQQSLFSPLLFSSLPG